MTTKKPRPGHTEAQTTSQVHDAAALFGLKLERRNAGQAQDARGNRITIGRAGDPDWYGVVPAGPHKGRALYVELKRGGFDPSKGRGEEADRFGRQLARLKELNASGALALWVDSGDALARFLARVAEWPAIRVEFDADGWPFMTDEPNP